MLVAAIMETVSNLKYPVKLKVFDKMGFVYELKTFFEKEKLL